MSSRDQRETKAFEILVRENSRMLTTYLRSLVSDEGAVDDLFQETMVVAWRRLDQCDLSRPFGPWLRGIASRLVMAHYRKRKRLPIALDEKVLSLLDANFDSIHAHPTDTWDEKLASLELCITALPKKFQDVVRLRYMEEQPAQRVAEQLSLSMEACKKRLQRARSRLADCLRRKGLLAAEGMP